MRVTASTRGHPRWPVEGRYSPGVKAGELIFVGGQADLDAAGRVGHPGDLEAQTAAAIANIAAVLAELGADLEDLVNLVAFYESDGARDEWDFLRLLRRALGPGPRPVVSAIPVPYLPVPGAMVEIEAVAMRASDGRRLARVEAAPAGHWRWPAGIDFPQGLRAGTMIFVGAQMALAGEGSVLDPGDIVGQSERVMDNVAAVLGEFGATLDDAVRFKIFYRGTGATEDWEIAARVRARYFTEPGPCATGIPVPGFFPDGLAIKMWVWAMLGSDGGHLAREHAWPEGSWDWTFHLPYKHGLKCGDLVFVGGQVPLDQAGRALAVGDVVAQTHIAMGYLSRVMGAFGLTLDHIVKINGFYADAGGADAMARNLGVRSSFFKAPGPTTSETALPYLALDDMAVEIEVVASTA
jgi:enamine deaminase RidA (YjgF/YER057c/UK114 family)